MKEHEISFLQADYKLFSPFQTSAAQSQELKTLGKASTFV